MSDAISKLKRYEANLVRFNIMIEEHEQGYLVYYEDVVELLKAEQQRGEAKEHT